MTTEEKVRTRLQDIHKHPERHRHTFGGLDACSTIDGSIYLHLMGAHPALGYNGGQKCDVTSGPCACGAWHR